MNNSDRSLMGQSRAYVNDTPQGAGSTPAGLTLVAELGAIANDLDGAVIGLPSFAESPRARVTGSLRDAADEIERLSIREGYLNALCVARRAEIERQELSIVSLQAVVERLTAELALFHSYYGGKQSLTVERNELIAERDRLTAELAQKDSEYWSAIKSWRERCHGAEAERDRLAVELEGEQDRHTAALGQLAAMRAALENVRVCGTITHAVRIAREALAAACTCGQGVPLGHGHYLGCPALAGAEDSDKQSPESLAPAPRNPTR